jgi:hypothetical protein
MGETATQVTTGFYQVFLRLPSRFACFCAGMSGVDRVVWFAIIPDAEWTYAA